MVSVRDQDKDNFLPTAKRFASLGCRFVATEGTADFLEQHNLPVVRSKSVSKGVPNVLDVIRSGMVDLIIDIPKKGNDISSDGFKLRRCAAECSVTLLTSLDTIGALIMVAEERHTPDNTDIIAVEDIV